MNDLITRLQEILDYDAGHCRGDVCTQLELWIENAKEEIEILISELQK